MIVEQEDLARASVASARDLAQYLVDLTKAEALQFIGDQEAVIKYVTPHV